MRKLPVSVLLFLSVALAIAPPGQAPKTAASNLAAFIPVGSLLCLQSPDFAALVHDWEGSAEKPKWLTSANYQEFSRSRLFLRLEEAQAQFASAAGAPPNMAMVDSVAGDQSALALYDVGNLEFLYITHLPSARAVQNVLWSSRAKFEPRKAADAPYYVRTDPTSNRVVAFAISGDYLLLATREDLMVSALMLLSGATQPSLQDEAWYKRAVSAAGPAGDLRMVLNMPALVKSPHFRTYWIERNITELKSFSAEISDLHRSSTEYQEDRVLLKADSDEGRQTPAEANNAIAEVLGRVPEHGGIYRAWSAPSAEAVVDLLSQKILAPHSGAGATSNSAPAVALGNGETGSEGDLETRINVAPLLETPGALRATALLKLLKTNPPEAVLEFTWLPTIERSPFVTPRSAVVIRGTSSWNREAARTAIREAIEGLYTVSQIGVGWAEHQEGIASYDQLDGLLPVAVATQGPVLIVADSAEALKPLLTAPHVTQSAPNLTYAAGLRLSAEREGIVKMMRLIETPAASEPSSVPGQPGREPLFFSEDLASLSRSLDRVESEEVRVEDRGSQLRQSVVYLLKSKP